MLSQSQVELVDGPMIRAVLDNGLAPDRRYTTLFDYYAALSPEENHNFRLAVLAKVFKERTKSKNDHYKDRLTPLQRKDLYRLLITKDLLLRNKHDNKVLKSYLQYHAAFDLSRQEMKDLVQVYGTLSGLLTDAVGFVDRYYKEEERGVGDRTTALPAQEFTGPAVSPVISELTGFEIRHLPGEPITKWVEVELKRILSNRDVSKCFDDLRSFIAVQISPFDARRFAYQLSSIKNSLTALFHEKFPPGSARAVQLQRALTQKGMADDAWYADSTYVSGNPFSSVNDAREARKHKDREYIDRRSYASPKGKVDPAPVVKPPERKVVVNKKKSEQFRVKLAAALKAEEGKSYDEVIRIVLKLTTDEVRYCLSIFFSFQQHDSISPNIKSGYRTRQVFSELIQRGARACDLENDFVEEFHLKFQPAALTASLLDDAQRYFVSLEQPAGAYQIDAKAFQSEIRKVLLECSEKRKMNTSMVFSMIAYHRKTFDKDEFRVSELVKLDPVNDENLKKRVASFAAFQKARFEERNYGDLLTNFRGFRKFLRQQDSELKLFQVLKWVGEYLNSLAHIVVGREMYLEVYSAITWYAFNKKKIRAYTQGLPKIDGEYFLAPIRREVWERFENDYLTRLSFAGRYPGKAAELTDYMLYLFLLSEKKNTPLVPNYERELVIRAREKNWEHLKERKVVPDRGYPSVVHNLKIGSTIAGFTVYYIAGFKELNVSHRGGQTIYVRHEKIKSFLFEVPYESIGEKQFGDFIADLYARTSHLEGAIQFFFKVIGYLPVLIISGPVALMYEVMIDEASAKLGEEIGKHNKTAGTIVRVAGGVLAPRPKSLYASKADQKLVSPFDDVKRGLPTVKAPPVVSQLDNTRPPIASRAVDDTSLVAGKNLATVKPANVKYTIAPGTATVISKAPVLPKSLGAAAYTFTGRDIGENIGVVAKSVGLSKKMVKKALSHLKRRDGIRNDREIVVNYNGDVYHKSTGAFLDNVKDAANDILYLKTDNARALYRKLAADFGKKKAKEIMYSIENRHKLREAMGITDINLQAHHIIPVEMLKSNPVAQAAVAGGFQFNGLPNGLPLSRTIHLTGHDPYNELLHDRLAQWANANPKYTPSMAKQFLETEVIPEWKQNFVQF